MLSLVGLVHRSTSCSQVHRRLLEFGEAAERRETVPTGKWEVGQEESPGFSNTTG